MKITLRAKSKSASREERLLKWKEHFKNLVVNPPEITDKLIEEIIHAQLDITLGHFMADELDTVSKKNNKIA